MKLFFFSRFGRCWGNRYQEYEYKETEYKILDYILLLVMKLWKHAKTPIDDKKRNTVKHQYMVTWPFSMDSIIECIKSKEERERMARAIDALADCDFIVLDTPGSDNHLSREGHFHADILVTPLNDSFVDLDLLGRIDLDTYKLLSPSKYSEMVWEQKKRRMQHGQGSIDWIVMRNRLASLESRNKRNMDQALLDLSRRLGLRLIIGFSERVIFRELFLKGLTLLDLRDEGTDVTLTMSHIAALQEVRSVLQAIGIERKIEEDITATPSELEFPRPSRTMA